jgi:hypothetical protein
MKSSQLAPSGRRSTSWRAAAFTFAGRPYGLREGARLRNDGGAPAQGQAARRDTPAQWCRPMPDDALGRWARHPGSAWATSQQGNPAATSVSPAPGTHLAPSGNHLVRSGSHLGAAGNHLGNAGSRLGAAESHLGVAGSRLGTSGNPLGTSGNPLGTSGSPLGTSGNSLGTSGNSLGTFGNPLGTRESQLGECTGNSECAPPRAPHTPTPTPYHPGKGGGVG